MRNLNELSNDRQVCLVPNPNSKKLGYFRKKLLTHSERTVCECLLNTEATTVTIQGGKKLGYALPLNTDFQSVEKLEKI